MSGAATLRHVIGAAIRPRMALAKIKYLLETEPAPVDTFELRRVALAEFKLVARRSRKDRVIPWERALRHWCRFSLPDLAPDDRAAIVDALKAEHPEVLP